MANDRPFSAGAGLGIAGITLASMGLCGLTAGALFADSPGTPSGAIRARAAILSVPLSFEPNEGQTDSRVKFLSHGDGYSLFLTSNEAVFQLRTHSGVGAPPSVFRMELAGASREAQVYGTDKLPGAANYFIGSDPKKWRSGIGEYGKVNYHGVYPGIDAVFYGNQRQLEYDFVVAPNADARQISLAIAGATPRLDREGNVSLKLADGDLALKKPVVYQDIDGHRKFIDAGYAIAGNRVRFHLGKYDHSRTLTIDPVFTYLTYLGGSGADQIGVSLADFGSNPTQAIAIDSAGNVYVTGYTLSTDFPLAHPYQSAPHNKTNWNVFVSALNPSGTALLFSTYLGGSVFNAGSSIAWDSHDNSVYVAGTTSSPDFPIMAGAFQSILAPGLLGVEYSTGQQNAFVAKFNAAGQLTNSTFLGGNSTTLGVGVATDPQGRAYVVGGAQYDCSSGPSYECFPTTPGAVMPAGKASGHVSAFVSVFDPNLSTLLYSTILGDPNGAQHFSTEAFGVTVDPSGNFYVVGITGADALPTTPGAYQPKLGTSIAQPLVGFAAKFGPVGANGASLTYLTYLEATGISFGDYPSGVAADSQGNAYIGGYTNSLTFPVTAGAYITPCSLNGADLCPAAFVTKLNPAGTGLVWSSFVEPADFVSAIQLDAQGNIYVVGHSSGNFLPLVNPLEPGLIAGGFVAELDPTGSSLLFATVIGASPALTNNGNSTMAGVAVDSQGNVYVAGNMNDSTLPTTPGVVQPKFAGGSGAQGDGFIAKINLAPSVLSGGVVPVYSSSTTIQPGEWASIYGTGLATGTTLWTGNYPTSLGGTSVTINGKLAYLSLVSPTQINFQAPMDTASGSVPVVVKTQNGTATSTVTLAQLAPSLFLLDSRHVAGIILRSNGTGAFGGGTYDILGPTGSSLGYPTVAAKAGDSIALYGTGFGPTSPPVTPGQPFSGAAPTTNPVTLTINGVSVTPSFAGLSGSGVDQMNFTVPAGLGSGDLTLVASVGGLMTQPTVVISLQ